MQICDDQHRQRGTRHCQPRCRPPAHPTSTLAVSGYAQRGLRVAHDLLRVRREPHHREQDHQPVDKPGAHQSARVAERNTVGREPYAEFAPARKPMIGQRKTVQTRHATQYGCGRGQAVGTKHHPAHDHRNKRDDTRRSTPHHRRAMQVMAERFTQRTPAVVYAKVDAMQQPPQHKRPARAVPQPSQQHGEQQIDIAPRRAFAAAAQRHIQVVA